MHQAPVRVLGAAGVALPSAAGDELVVTTFDGDLFVLGLGTGNLSTAPVLYRTWAVGSLGAYNSIIIDDLDLDGANEMYVAGSMGVHKYVQR